ncbi:MAG: biotin transporter BioY [Methylocystaceae bacterium]
MSTTPHNPLRQNVYAAIFGALTAVGAFIVIPLQPVPITLQTFFTALAGLLLGGYAGALSQVIYILLGVIGLPVFAGGTSGFGTLLGPAGGYLIGFVVAAFVIGKVVETRLKPGLVWIVLAIILGDLTIYFFGVGQLALVGHLTIPQALMAGVVPFLIGDALKLVVAALLSLRLRDILKL